MNRRDFMVTGAGGALASAVPGVPERAGAHPTQLEVPPAPGVPETRRLFERAGTEVFLNAAGGTPLGDFALEGLRTYESFWRLGPGEGRGERIGGMLDQTRAGLARLIGAEASEIALVQCTKEGERIVMAGLSALRDGGNLVTNDLHFGGSLHNLIGMRRAGLDLRIVRSRDWRTDLDAMADAIDGRTALVSVTLLSNVNGHIEPIQRIAELAHAHGAWVYADLIQAVGITPVDVREMGIDFAAGNGYKWLFGPHGTGFLYVRKELQGAVLEDRVFPGSARANYEPWVEDPALDEPDFLYQPRSDAQRYQVGHQAYYCYAATREGIRFIDNLGHAAVLEHSVGLCGRLVEELEGSGIECISPHPDRSPIVTFRVPDPDLTRERLRAARVTVALSHDRLRVSPSVYNDEGDIESLAAVLTGD